jgi:hypothetical protein
LIIGSGRASLLPVAIHILAGAHIMQMVVETIESVEEVEPSIFQIVVVLQEGSIASLRLNSVTLQTLMANIVLHTIG